MFLLQVTPGFPAQTFRFPKCRVSETLRAADDDTVDMSLEPAIEQAETELLAIFALGAQIESGQAQPVHHLRLVVVAALEDAQDAPGEVLAWIYGCGGVLELQGALAGNA